MHSWCIHDEFPFRFLENGLNAIARRRTNIRSGQVRILFAIFSFFLSFVMLQNVCLAQASARGEYVEKDSPVVVIAVTGNQIIVRKKDD